jgi:[FeFe] hydrogenase H-cluster maturation GTPase HydF
MEQTPKNIRYSITLVGRTNAGKSSLINALCEQDVAIVSEVPGTTTDPVGKAYELIGFGPVMFYDTAGLDDDSELGKKRKAATLYRLNVSDFALIVVGDGRLTDLEKDMIEKSKIPYLVVYNKVDLFPVENLSEDFPEGAVSASTGLGISELRSRIIAAIPRTGEPHILADVVRTGDKVVLVCPIDASAPKGRLILPQVQTTRELLDLGCIAITVQVSELSDALSLGPSLVITDSQAIKKVAEIVPDKVPLTTFSILFGRLKGDFRTYYEGAKAIDSLRNGDRVLIAEACSHVTVEDDIGRDKLPKWLARYTGRHLDFAFAKGAAFPDDLQAMALALHCGSCMLTEKETRYRIERCEALGVPITNYGMAISKCQGLLDRVLKIFQSPSVPGS